MTDYWGNNNLEVLLDSGHSLAVLELDVCAITRSCLLLESRLRYLRNDFDQGQIFPQCSLRLQKGKS